MRVFFRLAPLGLVAAAALLVAGAMPDFGARSADPAPGFTLTDTDGNEHTLSDYEGEWVVLEWLNFDCPFVGKHYNGGNMQNLQSHYTDLGVTWFSVVSSAPGEQGHFPPDQMNARNEEHGGQQTAILMDPTGEVGQAYGARTTPHMFVINPQGEIVYNGAIDDRPSADPATLEGATNYVVRALTEATGGQDVTTPRTQPYGCSVKYAS